jgi:hypothetical protein
VGAKVWPSVAAAAAAVVRVAERIPADAKSVELMKAAYVRYRRVYPATRAIFA